MTERRRIPRTGFTLIELLVVMAIIATLLALLTVGIMKVAGRTQQSQTQQDIIELAQGLENFKTKFGMYPPSSLNANNVLTVMAKLWPALNPPVGSSQTLDDRVNAALAPLGLNCRTIDLQGDQCVVLFLGGLHLMSAGQPTVLPAGFSENPMSPFEAGGNRIGPFFKFKSSRLFQRSASVPIASYGDGFFGNAYGGLAQNSCYAYFSTSFVNVPVALPAGSVGVGYYSETDCNRVTDGAGGFPRPFINLNSTRVGKYEYVNPKSFQIISPGPDTVFGNNSPAGAGSAYKFPASKPGSDFGANPNSADNYSNFYEGRLGES